MNLYTIRSLITIESLKKTIISGFPKYINFCQQKNMKAMFQLQKPNQ
jgi:hypothetical protein